ncbi:hypothetical protein L1987_83965 [Smallanthus sonchifolius]|uniref:Uncharacterized protein n=1 Tax=Smallanthus sonchifolius TaxID=185202 RepID=A0ACB8YDH1_9ASTR|nr:hypothetical protein L1987_83965 [Smallanthus sonchifolius]
MRLKLWLGSLLVTFASLSNAIDAFVGINIDTNQSNLPSPELVVGILRTHHVTHVRLFDTNARLLSALSDTGIEVMISVTNGEVLGIGESPSNAASWVNTHVAAFKPATNITAIAVGSEFLPSNPNAAIALVPAMTNLYKALVASNLNDQIKVSTPLSMDMISKPFPPSTATFNISLNSTIYEILDFLKETNSFYMLNAFPYDSYVQSNGIFPIQYAFFQPLPVVKQIVDPNTLFHYESMLDAMVDATYYSISAYNFSVIPIVVTETGWPGSGGANESDATVENAETFNNNLIKRVLSGSGPPSQPAVLLNSYIYEMFDDDKKPSYGVFFRNGSSVYDLDFGGSTGNFSGGFCVARKGADPASLQGGLNWACGPGQANCTAIQSGQPCYLPDTVQNHASYAYNDYYQRKRRVGGTCVFGGTAVLTNVNPSYGSCTFIGSSNSSAGGVSSPTLGPAAPTGSASPQHRVLETGVKYNRARDVEIRSGLRKHVGKLVNLTANEQLRSWLMLYQEPRLVNGSVLDHKDRF